MSEVGHYRPKHVADIGKINWICSYWGQNLNKKFITPLKLNEPYRGRTAPLTSIYSTNISTEYFKHGTYFPIFLFKKQFVS